MPRKAEAAVAELALPAEGRAAPAGRGLALAIAGRNLWRNGRRTWLTAGGIAFAIALTVIGMALQHGSYSMQIDAGTSFMAGHLQVQRQDYLDQSRFEQTIGGITELVRRLERQPGVQSVAPRVEASALVSGDERSFGAQVLGVDLERENRTVRFFSQVARGRPIAGGDEAVIGAALARNLELDLGGELVVLGSGKEGGVAALVLEVVGIFESGIADLDRAMVIAPIETVQQAFGLGDEAHSLTMRIERAEESARLAEALNPLLPEGTVARGWQQALPELHQGIEMDRVSARFFYGLIMVVVTFSVVNSFIMTVFERIREFGMLRAIGMRPGRILWMVQVEAACLWALGAGLGLALSVAVVLLLGLHGIPLGGIEDMAANMFIPDRLHPALSASGLVIGPLLMLAGTQIAALIPSLRIRRLQTVAALRSE